MPVIAIPKDIEFRKVTPTQQKSLDKITGDNKNKLLTAVAIPTVALTSLALVGGTVYLFREQLKTFVEENFDNLGEAITEKIKGFAEGAGGVVADTITNVVGRDEPITPEFLPDGTGPLPRCLRWTSDYVESRGKQEGASRTELTLIALAQLNIIKNMKREKCDKPSQIPQSQWDEV